MSIFARMRSPGFFGPLLILLSLNACSDEIRLTTQDGSPIPVVYAIFDTADSIHFVKLEKSFAEEQAVQNSLISENLFYSAPQISLFSVATQTSFLFDPVEYIVKDTGFFPSHLNRCYQLDAILDAGEYFLRIKPDEEAELIEEKVILFSDLQLYYPSNQSKRIYFYDDPVSFIWSSSDYSSVFEVAFTLEFEEINLDNKREIKRITYSKTVNYDELEWMQNRWKFRLYSDPFFAKLGRSLSQNNILYRKPLGLSMSITGADSELHEFIRQNSPDTEIKINYTGNLTHAIGIAASKHTVKRTNLQFSPKAMDSLRAGRFTSQLKFINNSDW